MAATHKEKESRSFYSRKQKKKTGKEHHNKRRLKKQCDSEKYSKRSN